MCHLSYRTPNTYIPPVIRRSRRRHLSLRYKNSHEGQTQCLDSFLALSLTKLYSKISSKTRPYLESPGALPRFPFVTHVWQPGTHLPFLRDVYHRLFPQIKYTHPPANQNRIVYPNQEGFSIKILFPFLSKCLLLLPPLPEVYTRLQICAKISVSSLSSLKGRNGEQAPSSRRAARPVGTRTWPGVVTRAGAAATGRMRRPALLAGTESGRSEEPRHVQACLQSWQAEAHAARGWSPAARAPAPTFPIFSPPPSPPHLPGTTFSAARSPGGQR